MNDINLKMMDKHTMIDLEMLIIYTVETIYTCIAKYAYKYMNILKMDILIIF